MTTIPAARSPLDPHWRLIRRLAREMQETLGLDALRIGVPAAWVPENDPLIQPAPTVWAWFASSENLERLQRSETVQGQGLQPWPQAAFVAIPLVPANLLWRGVLLAVRSEPFSPEEVWRLEHEAAEVALVVDHWGSLHGEERATQAEETLAVLGGLARTLQQATSPQEAMEHTCRTVRRWVKAKSVSVLLPDEEGNLVLAASAGIDPIYLQRARLPKGQGIGSEVFRTGQPALVPDTHADPRFVSIFPEHRAMVVVPLGFGPHRLGTLSADSSRVGAFDRRDVHRLTLAATLLSGFLLQHQLRQRLAQTESRLQAQERQYSEALDHLLHEIGGPLTYLLGYIALLFEHPVVRQAPEVQRYLMVMDRKARSLQRFVERMRSSLYFTPEPRPLDVRDVAQQAVELLRHEAENRGVNLHLQVQEPIPLVHADPEGVTQVLENLLSNAIQHSPPGGTVRVLIEPLPDVLRVSVMDQGPGVPPEAQERIFERFFRLQRGPGEHPRRGMGVGLALAREIVRAHGGRIWVDSKPGQGATFAFTLPYYTPPVEDEA